MLLLLLLLLLLLSSWSSWSPWCEQGKRYLFSKGADSKIYSKLAPQSSVSATEWDAMQRTLAAATRHMSSWGEDGLRTLCFGYRRLTDEEFESWFAEYNAALRNDEEKVRQCALRRLVVAQCAHTDRCGAAVRCCAQAKFDRHITPNAIDTAMDRIESLLVLQGATANEDRLQEDVPETIATLVDAGVKVRLLRGSSFWLAVAVPCRDDLPAPVAADLDAHG